MTDDQRITIIKETKAANVEFRKRRHSEWTENYTLYRDKVITNRLTQRQSVNIPIMKYSIKSLLKDIDEPPLLYFHNLDNDDQKELYYNEVWKEAGKQNKLVIKDIIDKKQVFLFGRSFKKLNIVNGKFFWEIVDPQDIAVDKYIDPSSIDSARSIVHEHIYKPLSSLEFNSMYDQDVVNELKSFYGTQLGLIRQEEIGQAMHERDERMRQMGLDVNNPIIGETYVELNEIYRFQYDEVKEKDVIFLTVTVDNSRVLMEMPLYQFIGETKDEYWNDHYPFTSWGDDYDRTDFWSDSVADTLRPINRVLNAWFSQMVENRTLRNFGMHYYDSTGTAGKSFIPQTFVPQPWGWYPLPGKPSEVMEKVDVPDLSDSLEEINFLMNIAEKATAATSTQQGGLQERKVTLGEVQLALQNAKERIKSMAVYYNDSWEEFGNKYIKLVEAASDLLGETQIVRKGKLGIRNYTYVVSPKDYLAENGVHCEVKQVADKSQEDIDNLQKLRVARAEMPNNKALKEISDKLYLQFAGLPLDDIDRVLAEEKQAREGMGQNPMLNPGAPTSTNQPVPQLPPPQPVLQAG